MEYHRKRNSDGGDSDGKVTVTVTVTGMVP